MAKATDGVPRAPEPELGPLRLDRPRPWALCPSDLTFLWEECRRCFYDKIVLGRRRPSTPFPKVFGVIDRAMKDFCLGERAEAIAPGMPVGVFGSPDRWVKSAPIALPGRARPVVLRGRLDALVACDDGTDAVVDFKTALASDAHIPFYARQLHAYAWALERPASGSPTAVSALGLLCFAPNAFDADKTRAALFGDLSWIDVPRSDRAFEAFLIDVISKVEAPDAPDPSPGCAWCVRASLAA
jgi:hypothetical protein